MSNSANMKPAISQIQTDIHADIAAGTSGLLKTLVNIGIRKELTFDPPENTDVLSTAVRNIIDECFGWP